MMLDVVVVALLTLGYAGIAVVGARNVNFVLVSQPPAGRFSSHQVSLRAADDTEEHGGLSRRSSRPEWSTWFPVWARKQAPRSPRTPTWTSSPSPARPRSAGWSPVLVPSGSSRRRSSWAARAPTSCSPISRTSTGSSTTRPFAATYRNGRSCLAGTRLFVHDDLYDTFLGKLRTSFEGVLLGSPSDPATRLGCLVSQRQGERVLDYIASGKREANLVTGGGRATVDGSEHGWFIEPTVFETTNNSRIAQEETFGPVLSVIR